MYSRVRTIHHIFIMVLDVSCVRLYDSLIKFFTLISQELMNIFPDSSAGRHGGK